MKRIVMLLGFLSQLIEGRSQNNEYDSYPVYSSNDLGVTFSKGKTIFKLWAPSATEARVYVYKEVTDQQISAEIMKKGKDGVWVFETTWDIKGWGYGFRVLIKDKWSDIVTDPYAKAVTINGTRGVVMDMKETNPPGWAGDKSPAFKNPTDAVIYELQVRDASIAANSGIRHKGKFLGLTETGTKNAAGLSTGLDHLKELDVTHVHLMPFFDFRSIDEAKPGAPYNWGYDPQNYNVPEGSFSTNPADPVARIREFKELVQTFHKNGLRVVMDVVYNHTGLTENSNFNQLVPGYYYRQTKDGKFSNATACGNETASERPMMRKFILESMKYWVQEYHIDGFRVDLMGVHDIETMNIISKELHKIKPGILLYGEGWTAGASPLPDSLRALKANVSRLDRIAVFSDDIRDGIKGHVFTPDAKGFASGQTGLEESIKFGIAAACHHPQVDYSKVNYSKKPYAKEPYQTVTYADCHDNHCLRDRITNSAKEATGAERIEMNKLALSIVLTSQGISFLHAGSEFLRTKKGMENSFESPDSINAIDWNLKSQHKDVFGYVKGLIAMRKAHPAFRLTKGEEIAKYLVFLDSLPAGVLGYHLNGKAVKDKWQHVCVYYNGTGQEQEVWLDSKYYMTAVLNNTLVEPANVLGKLTLTPYSCTILYK